MTSFRIRFPEKAGCRLGFHRWTDGTCRSCGVQRTTQSLRKLKKIALDFHDPDAFLAAIKRLAGYKSVRSETWGRFELKKGNHSVILHTGRDISSRHDLIYSMIYEHKIKQIRCVLIENGSFTYA